MTVLKSLLGLWPAVSAVSAVTALSAPTAHAQLPDPYTIPRGVMRVSFDPQWMSFAELFDAAGTRRPLGVYFSADPLGANLIPTATDAETAVRSITGDASYRLNGGRFVTRLDGDHRRIPLSLSFGLSSRLTLTANVALVTARMKSATSLDTTDAEAGWNPIGPNGVSGGLDTLTLLLGELDGAVGQLEAAIAAGDFDCPNGPVCDEARALAARAQALSADLRLMTGFAAATEGGSGSIPPFAPLQQSDAGLAIGQAIADVSAGLQSLGQAPLTVTMPLPTERLPQDAVDQVLASPTYDALPLNPEETIKLSGLGDVELGLRYGLASKPTFRAVLGALVRLPTGKKQDDPNDFVDFAPADGQLDVAVSLDGSLEPGSRIGLWFAGSYNMQFGDHIVRRIARADQPIVPASAVADVQRNLGDEIRASVHPALRLTPEFRAFVSAGVYHKTADRYTLAGATVPELEALTAMTIWTIGGGIWYRMERNRRGLALPIEAGFVYSQALNGTGGTAPKFGRMNLSLRFYYNLWGKGTDTEPEASPEAEPVTR